MGAFNEAELEYLRDGRMGPRRLGRIATVGRDGTPHVVPVGWSYNAEHARSTSAGTTSSARRSSAMSFAPVAPRSWSTTWRAPTPGARAAWRSAAARRRSGSRGR